MPDRQLVSAWDSAGRGIGNHSCSHPNLNSESIGLDAFESGVVKDEPLIRGCHNFVPLFRFPFFKEGNTTTKRDGIRSFLKRHSYRIGRATVDASDWAISARLENEHKLAASQHLRLTRTSCCGTSGNELNSRIACTASPRTQGEAHGLAPP
jgi:peptidoglycan-N-acetylglucosamine deacetylase